MHANECRGGEIKEKAGTIAGFEDVASCGVERNAENRTADVVRSVECIGK